MTLSARCLRRYRCGRFYPRSFWTRAAVLLTPLLLAFPLRANFPPGKITSIQRDSAGVVRLDLRDPFQGSATVERSLDLITWDSLTTVSLRDREALFTDAQSPPGAAFYRLAPPLIFAPP